MNIRLQTTALSDFIDRQLNTFHSSRRVTTDDPNARSVHGTVEAVATKRERKSKRMRRCERERFACINNIIGGRFRFFPLFFCRSRFSLLLLFMFHTCEQWPTRHTVCINRFAERVTVSFFSFSSCSRDPAHTPTTSYLQPMYAANAVFRNSPKRGHVSGNARTYVRRDREIFSLLCHP